MKRVVSLSLGSSSRDKTVTVELLGETIQISREGVDGDEKRFVERLAALDTDPSVNAIGFGGMDRYLWSEGKRFEFTSAARLLSSAKNTPVLDGSGLKNTLEREAVRWLAKNGVYDFKSAKTLVVSGVDRFGMSEALDEQGGQLVFGDLMFGLGLPFPIHGRAALRKVARAILPIVMRMPLSVLYPMGDKQNEVVPKWTQWYNWADLLAGDFHYIRRHMPASLTGKTVLTNTTTENDLVELKKRGVKTLITTTPNFEGRSFATNVMEATLVALNDGKELTEAEYLATLQKLQWTPNVVAL